MQCNDNCRMVDSLESILFWASKIFSVHGLVIAENRRRLRPVNYKNQDFVAKFGQILSLNGRTTEIRVQIHFRSNSTFTGVTEPGLNSTELELTQKIVIDIVMRRS
jgi:hypothetical protein